MDAQFRRLFAVSFFAMMAFPPPFAQAMSKAKDCIVELNSRDIAPLFDKYVRHGSNGRSPAAAIYQIDPTGDVVRTLFSRGAGNSQAVASTQKIVTAWTAVKYGKLSQKIRFTESDLDYDLLGGLATWPSSGRQIVPGDDVPLSTLIRTLLEQSSNGAAQAIARGVGNGDVRTFVKLMNQEARLLLEANDVRTYFQNPNGLTDDEPQYRFGEPGRRQLSTASNMARIIGRIMSNEGFVNALKSTGLPDASNRELQKAGFTQAAGRTWVARLPLESTCGNRGVAMAFFGANESSQFVRFADLIYDLRNAIEKNTNVIR